MTAVKIVGRAPFAIRNSAIGRLPTWDAASIGVSQSPKPQSHDARASAGLAVTSSFTRAMFPCEAPTTSFTDSSSCAGKRGFEGPVLGTSDAWLDPRNPTAGTTPRNPRREIDMADPPARKTRVLAPNLQASNV